MAKIKHVPTNEVHILKPDGKTGCGTNTNEKPECWEKVSDYAKITCEKIGCRQ